MCLAAPFDYSDSIKNEIKNVTTKTTKESRYFLNFVIFKFKTAIGVLGGDVFEILFTGSGTCPSKLIKKISGFF